METGPGTPFKVGNEITDHLNTDQRPSETVSLSEDVPAQALADLNASFDNVNGGFGTAPKFPTPAVLCF